MQTIKGKVRYSRLVIPIALGLSLASFLLGPGHGTGAVTSQSYSYDDAGRLTRVTYSDGRTITYTYDAMGNLVGSELTKKDEIFFDGFEQLALLSRLRWGD